MYIFCHAVLMTCVLHFVADISGMIFHWYHLSVARFFIDIIFKWHDFSLISFSGMIFHWYHLSVAWFFIDIIFQWHDFSLISSFSDMIFHWYHLSVAWFFIDIIVQWHDFSLISFSGMIFHWYHLSVAWFFTDIIFHTFCDMWIYCDLFICFVNFIIKNEDMELHVHKNNVMKKDVLILVM